MFDKPSVDPSVAGRSPRPITLPPEAEQAQEGRGMSHAASVLVGRIQAPIPVMDAEVRRRSQLLARITIDMAETIAVIEELCALGIIDVESLIRQGRRARIERGETNQMEIQAVDEMLAGKLSATLRERSNQSTGRAIRS